MKYRNFTSKKAVAIALSLVGATFVYPASRAEALDPPHITICEKLGPCLPRPNGPDICLYHCVWIDRDSGTAIDSAYWWSDHDPGND